MNHKLIRIFLKNSEVCNDADFKMLTLMYCIYFYFILERIEERARRRRRKDREERRRDLEIQRAEDAKWGRTKSQPIVRLDSKVHFPGFSPSSNEPDFPKVAVDDSYEISPSSLEYNGQCNSGPSFAQVSSL